MNEWQIEMTIFDVNREIQCLVKADGLNEAKQAAIAEFRKQFPEKKNLYLEAKGKLVYAIVSNLVDVGEVRFEFISGK